MRYVFKVAYDGTAFCGWQTQKNGVSVQETLERAVFSAFGVETRVTASGRTDGGVHAFGQVCHADLPVGLPAEKIADALNPFLPQGVSVLASAVAPAGFDANRSAKRKTYEYRLYVSPRRHPLYERYAVRAKGGADVRKMQEAADCFVGEHDFSAYRASGSQALTSVRTVYSVAVTEKTCGDVLLITVAVCGNGFLYRMVRTMVGTMLYYAWGRLSIGDITASLLTGDRSLVGKTMPPEGLALKSVDYGIELFP